MLVNRWAPRFEVNSSVSARPGPGINNTLGVGDGLQAGRPLPLSPCLWIQGHLTTPEPHVGPCACLSVQHHTPLRVASRGPCCWRMSNRISVKVNCRAGRMSYRLLVTVNEYLHPWGQYPAGCQPLCLAAISSLPLSLSLSGSLAN